jgi:hypothetical protein
MRTRVGAVVWGYVALLNACACGTRHLNDADAGRGGNDAGPGSAQTSFTVDWTASTPGRGIRLACSSGGDAIAYYMQVPASQTRRYHAGAWADPVALPVWADQVQATALSSDGVATFVWTASSSSMPMTDDLYVDRLAPDDSWSGPSLIGDGGIAWWQDPNPPWPVLSLDASGSGLVAWSRIDQEARQPIWPAAVWAAHAAPDGTWLNEGSIDQPGATSSTRPSLLARAQSDTVAAWAWTDGTREQVLVARHSGSHWSAPSVVEDAAAADMSFRAGVGPMLAGGRTGDVVLVYSRVNQGATLGKSALVARYSPDGVSWSDAEVLASSGVYGFQLAHNGTGGAVVIWGDPGYVNTPPTPTAAMRVLVPGAGWSAPVAPMTSATGYLVAQRPDGRIAFLYADGDGLSASAIVIRTYTPAAGWQAAQVIDQAGQQVSDLCFAGDQFVAAWERSGTEGVVGVFP